MSRNRMVLVAAMLLAACAGRRPASSEATLQALLPETSEVAGFQRQGQTSFGQGLSGLLPILDGGAEAYVKLSAEAGVFQDYALESEPGEAVTVSIYRAKDAGRLYREIYPGRSRALSGLGQAARARLDVFGANELDFYQGQFYVELVINCGKPQALEHLRLFAQAISRRISRLP